MDRYQRYRSKPVVLNNKGITQSERASEQIQEATPALTNESDLSNPKRHKFLKTLGYRWSRIGQFFTPIASK